LLRKVEDFLYVEVTMSVRTVEKPGLESSCDTCVFHGAVLCLASDGSPELLWLLPLFERLVSRNIWEKAIQ
jgi:hypothetical protein